MRKFLLLILSGLLLATFYTGATSSDVQAQAAWSPPPRLQNLYDPAEITCTNAYDLPQARTTLQGAALQQIELEHAACMEGYNNHATANWCAQRNYGASALGKAQTAACTVGSERHGPDVVKFCSARHTVGVHSNAQNLGYNACREGFENGEGACNQAYPAGDASKAALREACIEGGRGKLYSTANTSNQQNTSTTPQSPQLGPLPERSDITGMAPGTNEVTQREVCSLEGFFGSMICSALTILGNATDASLATLGMMMRVDPLISNPSDLIFTYWKSFQTIANVTFIIALLVIIYSQITGMGISNYSLKKMVPRLIVGAVLMNMSFYLCAAAVDLSNILGTTVYSTMQEAIAPPSPTPVQADKNQLDMRTTPIVDPSSGEEITWSKVVTWMAFAAAPAAVAGGLLMNGGLAAFIPIIISAVVAIMIVLICLLLRQVLIVAFIVISPLAIAAFLLPNTKTLFDRWLKSFIPLLMLFPAIAFTFGIGSIVSEIIAAAAFAKPGFIEQSLFVLMALAIQIIPLLAVPKLMAVGGGLLAQLATAARGKTDGMNSKAKSFAERQRQLGDMRAMGNPTKFNKIRRMRAEHSAKNDMADHSLTALQKRQDPAVAAVGEGMREAAAPMPEAPTPAASSATEPNVVDTAETSENSIEPADATDTDTTHPTPAAQPSELPTDDDGFTKEFHIAATGKAAQVKARIGRFDAEHTPRNDLLAIAKHQTEADATTVEAAITKLASVGDLGAIFDMLKSSHTMTRSERHALVSGINSSGAGGAAAPMLGNQTAQDNILNGKVHGDYTDSNGVTHQSNIGSQVIAPSLQSDDYSGESMTSLDVDAAKEMNAAIRNAAQHGIRQEDINEVAYAANAALSNSNTERRVTKQRAQLEELRGYGR